MFAFLQFLKKKNPLFFLDLILNKYAFIFPKNMLIDWKLLHHFDDGIVDDFPGVDSYGEVHVRTAWIVEQL